MEIGKDDGHLTRKEENENTNRKILEEIKYANEVELPDETEQAELNNETEQVKPVRMVDLTGQNKQDDLAEQNVESEEDDELEKNEQDVESEEDDESNELFDVSELKKMEEELLERIAELEEKREIGIANMKKILQDMDKSENGKKETERRTASEETGERGWMAGLKNWKVLFAVFCLFNLIICPVIIHFTVCWLERASYI